MTSRAATSRGTIGSSLTVSTRRASVLTWRQTFSLRGRTSRPSFTLDAWIGARAFRHSSRPSRHASGTADVRLVVIGDGPMRARCEREVARHHVPDVTFAGFVEAKRLPGCYTAADVFCAPSTGQESFGIVLLEAMASGVAVVASSIPGYSRIIAMDRDGILVPPNDAPAWTRALRLLVDDVARRREMGQAGVAEARRYDWDRVARSILDVYAEAVWRHGHGCVAADLEGRNAADPEFS